MRMGVSCVEASYEPLSLSPAHVVKPLLCPNTIHDPRSCGVPRFVVQIRSGFIFKMALIGSNQILSFSFSTLWTLAHLFQTNSWYAWAMSFLSSSGHVFFILVLLPSSNLNTKILDFTKKKKTAPAGPLTFFLEVRDGVLALQCVDCVFDVVMWIPSQAARAQRHVAAHANSCSISR